MKICKSCKSEIASDAKICPQCKTVQKTPIILYILLGIIFVPMIVGSLSNDSTKDYDKNSTDDKDNLELLEGHVGKSDGNYSYSITGSLKNNTNKEYSYVSIFFYVYDKDGNVLDTCWTNNNGLEANGTWKFTASCFLSDGQSKLVTSYRLKEITGY